jgi:prevent-host-death family protein
LPEVDAVNVHEAKTHFSRLLDRVAKGEEIVIAKAGRPVAKLIPIRPSKPRRTPGLARGQIDIGPDFDDPLPWDIQHAFE